MRITIEELKKLKNKSQSQKGLAVQDRRLKPKGSRAHWYLSRVQWPWLCVAARLPGRALAVGLVACHLRNITKENTIKLRSDVLLDMGVNRYAKRRALRVLELAGLILTEQKPGQNPTVTVLDVSTKPTENLDSSEGSEI